MTEKRVAFEHADHLADDALMERMRDAAQHTPLHKLLRLTPVELDAEGAIVFEMPIADGALNSTGNLHGGAIATLIDMAAGTTVALTNPRFKPGENTLVTADMHIRYLARAQGAYVRATARPLRVGRQLTVVECVVHDEEGRLIATADFSSMLVPLRQAMRSGDAAQVDL